MSNFPVTIQRYRYASAAKLASALRERAINRVLDNPGQMYPSEHFVNQSDAANIALYEAVTLLVDDEDPEVVRIVVHLSPGHPDVAFWGALVDRFGGKSVPLPTELANEVGRLLVDPIAAHASLLERGLDAYANANMPEHIFRVRMQVGSTSDRISTLALAAAAGRVDVGLAKRAGRVLAKKDGAEGVLVGAVALFNAEKEVRTAFRAGAVCGDRSWAHRSDLSQALRLSS